MRGTGRGASWTRQSFGAALLWALAATPGSGAWAQEEGAGAAAPESVAASGDEQLKAANGIQRQSFKKKGEEKKAILLRAADAYRQVVERFPGDEKAASTALLRAGSILSGLKETERALASYREVGTRYSGEREACARALLEIGHILRRTKALDEALASYGECAKRFPDVDSPASQSLLWTGKIHRQRKRYEEARQAFRALVTDYTEPPSRIISAFDLLAASYLDEKQPERAAEVLKEVEQRFQASLASQEDDDRAIAADIRNMKSARALEKQGLRAAPPAPAPPASEPDVASEESEGDEDGEGGDGAASAA